MEDTQYIVAYKNLGCWLSQFVYDEGFPEMLLCSFQYMSPSECRVYEDIGCDSNPNKYVLTALTEFSLN